MVAVAPFAAALLADRLSWRAYFIASIALLGLAVYLASQAVPTTCPKPVIVPPRLVIAVSAGFASVDLALVAGRADLSIALAAAGVASLASARYRGRPAVRPAHVLATRAFVAAAFAALIVNALLCSIVFLIPLYDQMVLGLPLHDGALSLVVLATPPVILGPLVSRWTTSAGPRRPLAFGAVLATVGMVAASRWTSHIQIADTLPALTLIGVGLTALMAPLTATALSALPEERVVEGSALLASTRTLGVGIGAWATSLLAANAKTCTVLSHLCLDSLSRILTRPLLVDASAAALLALMLATALRRSPPAPAQ